MASILPVTRAGHWAAPRHPKKETPSAEADLVREDCRGCRRGRPFLRRRRATSCLKIRSQRCLDAGLRCPGNRFCRCSKNSTAYCFSRFNTRAKKARTMPFILVRAISAKGVAPEDMGISYTPFGHSDWQTEVAAIKSFASAGKKTAVVSTINGDANVPFYKELDNAASRRPISRSSRSRSVRRNWPASPGGLELLPIREEPDQRSVHHLSLGWSPVQSRKGSPPRVHSALPPTRRSAVSCWRCAMPKTGCALSAIPLPTQNSSSSPSRRFSPALPARYMSRRWGSST